MSATERYSIEDLAQRAGTSVRTIRYYIQESVIDPPRGRGRGRHFDDGHLDQLIRVRLLKLAGFDLATIRAKGADLLSVAKRLNSQGLFALEALSLLNSDDEPIAPSRRPDDATIIPMADGIDLIVEPSREIPPPKGLVEIALLIRKIFGETP